MKLSELGLTADVVKAVEDALKEKKVEVFIHESGKKIQIDDGNFVPLAEHKKLKDEKREVDQQLGEVNKKLKTLSESVKENEELKGKIDTMSTEIDTLKSDHEKSVKSLQKRHKIEARMKDHHGARVVDGRIPALSLVDLEKVSLDGENLVGLDDQVTALKESEDGKFLFGETKKSGTGHQQGKEPDPPSDLEKMSMEDFAKKRGYEGALKSVQ